jgi:hypothetical protein
MTNIEQQLLTRLNKYLKKYEFVIKEMPPNTFFSNENNNWAIYMSDVHGVYTLYIASWESFEKMMFSRYSLFDALKELKFYDISQCKGASLEEISIKLSLIGI